MTDSPKVPAADRGTFGKSEAYFAAGPAFRSPVATGRGTLGSAPRTAARGPAERCSNADRLLLASRSRAEWSEILGAGPFVPTNPVIDS
jgi:hypothetical protein